MIHQTNSGVSTVRNSGLDRATGEFIAFVDGDDLVCQNMYRQLLDEMDGKTDAVFYGVLRYFTNGKELRYNETSLRKLVDNPRDIQDFIPDHTKRRMIS